METSSISPEENNTESTQVEKENLGEEKKLRKALEATPKTTPTETLRPVQGKSGTDVRNPVSVDEKRAWAMKQVNSRFTWEEMTPLQKQRVLAIEKTYQPPSTTDQEKGPSKPLTSSETAPKPPDSTEASTPTKIIPPTPSPNQPTNTPKIPNKTSVPPTPSPTDITNTPHKAPQGSSIPPLSDDFKSQPLNAEEDRLVDTPPKNIDEYMKRNNFIIERTLAGLHEGSIESADTNFMSPAVERFLDSRSQLQTNNSLSLQRQKGNGRHVLNYQDEQWNVSEAPFAYMDGKETMAERPIILSRDYDDGRRATVEIPYGTFSSGYTDKKGGGIPGYIEYAIKKLESEKADAAGMADFDLPKDRPIGLISMNTEDAALAGTYGRNNFFPNLLRKQGYDIRSPQSGDLVIPSGGAEGSITQRIKELKGAKIKDIYLSLNGHGSPEGEMWIGKHDNQSNFSGKALAKIIRENPDMNFVINGTACYNGGIRVGLDSLPEADKKRVTAFLGTDRHAFNYSSGTYGNDDNILDRRPKEGYDRPRSADWNKPGAIQKRTQFSESSSYERFLDYYIGKGLPYGKAHLEADKASKRTNYVDPQAWKNGKTTASYEHPGDDEEKNAA